MEQLEEVKENSEGEMEKEKGKKIQERIDLRLRRELRREELCSQLGHHSPPTPLPNTTSAMEPSLQATPDS